MEFLKEILGDELFAQVEEKINAADGVKLANIADGSYIAKADYDKLNGEFEKFKAAPDNSEELETLRADKAKLEGDISKLKFDSALNLALATSGARNTKALGALIDPDKLNLTDEGLDGFGQQLAAVKEENPWLFGKEPEGTGMAHGTAEPTMDGVTKSFLAKNEGIKID